MIVLLPVRAGGLIEQSINEGKDTDTMNNPAGLPKSGSEGLVASPGRAVHRYERQIGEEPYWRHV